MDERFCSPFGKRNRFSVMRMLFLPILDRQNLSRDSEINSPNMSCQTQKWLSGNLTMGSYCRGWLSRPLASQ